MAQPQGVREAEALLKPTQYHYIRCGLYKAGNKYRSQVTVGTGQRFAVGARLEFEIDCKNGPTVWVWLDATGKKIYAASEGSRNQELKITGEVGREWV